MKRKKIVAIEWLDSKGIGDTKVAFKFSNLYRKQMNQNKSLAS